MFVNSYPKSLFFCLWDAKKAFAIDISSLHQDELKKLASYKNIKDADSLKNVLSEMNNNFDMLDLHVQRLNLLEEINELLDKYHCKLFSY